MDSTISDIIASQEQSDKISSPSQEDKIDTIVILDFGSQYSELIARRIRELKVYSEVVPYDIPLSRLQQLKPKAIVLSGGPASVYEEGAPSLTPEIFSLGIPVLGVCYGMQLMMIALGGKVERMDPCGGEYGKADLYVDTEADLFNGIEESVISWMSHGDSVHTLPSGFRVIGHTERTAIAAVANAERKLYGLQFHPEVVHSEKGVEILANFVYRIANCSASWTTGAFIQKATRDIVATVGDGRVLLALSGGVDSSTLAFLLHQAIGDQLTCMFIDQGFMRLNEPERLLRVFRDQFKIPVKYVDARSRFLEKMSGVIDPEQKRRVIGNEFIRVFEEESAVLGSFEFLAQGTLYSDVIESAGIPAYYTSSKASGYHSKVASKIKSHHNVGGLPQNMPFRLLEPLRHLFKDEVRRVGGELGVPAKITKRHPFPGPGLAIRIIGEVNEENLRLVRYADHIVREEVERDGLYDMVWQIFTVLLADVRSVGVMGDKRTYGPAIVLRAVRSEDGMTADWVRLPYDVLERISNRIINELNSVSRVVYDITSKPPGTIEWE